MRKITEIMRNNQGEIIKIVLNNGQKLELKQLFEIVRQENIGGAYIEIDAEGNRHLHIICDGDSGDDLDCLSLI